eukprot:CAMPEP_0178441818 /NCGR_PEP_ID=MMETSP0689_2-20121128/37734_1 /TAXON_ID=160604 /ORGANISM="Amphidinium massartii, Strain CS-259" /LENGTH=764 /DNA_ID=CAMNT_0020065123 /DNA_START=122 /DNA_END=2414 /DNA_ORIENTATION=-
MGINEAELMRDCGPLYVSIALESLATFIMALFFLYLLIMVTNKGRLQKPGRAFRKFVVAELVSFVKDLEAAVKKWKVMPQLPLAERFATCRKMNQAICSFQLLLAALTICRWLHIGNVNGIRYLGYSITCPPMQAEMLMLIAPIVPFYKYQIVFTYFITTFMLFSAWAGSLAEGDLFNNMDEAFDTGDFSLLEPQQKLYNILPGVSILTFLLFIQIPYLQALFLCRRSKMEASDDCPPGYLKLLVIVQLTWIAFPIWWLLGYEGLAIIKDTKANGVGFALLNVISKGSFSFHMISSSGQHRRMMKAKNRFMERQNSLDSLGSVEEDPEPIQEVDVGDAHESWLVRVLRPYDNATALPSKWKKLGGPFKGYCVGVGITPKMYDDMSLGQRKVLYARYEALCTDETGGDMLVSLPSNPNVKTTSGEQSEASLGNKYESNPAISSRLPVDASIEPLHTVPSPKFAEQDSGDKFFTPALHDGEPPKSVPKQQSAAKRTAGNGDCFHNFSPIMCTDDAASAVSRCSAKTQSDVCGRADKAPTPPHQRSNVAPVEESYPQGSPQPEPLPVAKKEVQPEQLGGGALLHMDDIIVGQPITTVTGLSGRVAQKAKETIVIMSSGGGMQTVSLDQISILLVSIAGARGLESLATMGVAPSSQSQVAVTCASAVVGKPSTKVKTKPALATSTDFETWRQELQVLGFASGDSIDVSVSSKTEGRTQETVLGRARIPSAELKAGCYEGELQLTGSDGKPLDAFVTILVMALARRVLE